MSHASDIMVESACAAAQAGVTSGHAHHHVQARNTRGFTLIELMVVIFIAALATSLVSLAMPDPGRHALARDAERLAALLETARAQSRRAGVAVHWQARPGGFRFSGLPDSAKPLPENWLSDQTQALGNETVTLGPEPLIGPQQLTLTSTAVPGLELHLRTDGLRPFRVVRNASDAS